MLPANYKASNLQLYKVGVPAVGIRKPKKFTGSPKFLLEEPHLSLSGWHHTPRASDLETLGPDNSPAKTKENKRNSTVIVTPQTRESSAGSRPQSRTKQQPKIFNLDGKVIKRIKQKSPNAIPLKTKKVTIQYMNDSLPHYVVSKKEMFSPKAFLFSQGTRTSTAGSKSIWQNPSIQSHMTDSTFEYASSFQDYQPMGITAGSMVHDDKPIHHLLLNQARAKTPNYTLKPQRAQTAGKLRCATPITMQTVPNEPTEAEEKKRAADEKHKKLKQALQALLESHLSRVSYNGVSQVSQTSIVDENTGKYESPPPEKILDWNNKDMLSTSQVLPTPGGSVPAISKNFFGFERVVRVRETSPPMNTILVPKFQTTLKVKKMFEGKKEISLNVTNNSNQICVNTVISPGGDGESFGLYKSTRKKKPRAKQLAFSTADFFWRRNQSKSQEKLKEGHVDNALKGVLKADPSHQARETKFGDLYLKMWQKIKELSVTQKKEKEVEKRKSVEPPVKEDLKNSDSFSLDNLPQNDDLPENMIQVGGVGISIQKRSQKPRKELPKSMDFTRIRKDVSHSKTSVIVLRKKDAEPEKLTDQTIKVGKMFENGKSVVG